MKTLILFREGLSGNYIKALIDDSARDINFRVDKVRPGVPNQVPAFLDPTKSGDHCVCLHPHLDDRKAYIDASDIVLTIQVDQKIYHACYNNFFKKHLQENILEQRKFADWCLEPRYWYDRIYYNIKEYHDLYQQDRQTNQLSNIIDFDHIYEEEYIETILDQYFQYSMTDNRRKIVRTYSTLQMPYRLQKDACIMEDILDPLPDFVFQQSPWFAAYCIFCFEYNNGLSETQRSWTINAVTQPIDKTFLLALPSMYK